MKVMGQGFARQPAGLLTRLVGRARLRKALSLAISRSEAFAISLMLSAAALCAAIRLELDQGEAAALVLAPLSAAAVIAAILLRFALSLRSEARPAEVAREVDRSLNLGEEFSTAFEIQVMGLTGLFEDALVRKSSSTLDQGRVRSLFPVRWLRPAWGAALAALLFAALFPFADEGGHPPAVYRVSPAAAVIEIMPGARQSFCAAATDQGEDMCRFEVEVDGRIEWSIVQPLRGFARMSRTLLFENEGAYRVILRFGDSAGDYGAQSWTVNVRGEPRPPVVERLRPAREKPRFAAGEKAEFEARATDPDADLARWEVSVDRASVDGGRGKLGSSAQRSWSRSWDSPGNRRVTMSFADSTGRVASVSWDVEVYEPGQDASGESGMGDGDREEPLESPDAAGGGEGGESGGSPMLGEPERTPAQFEDVRVQPLFGPSGQTLTASVKVPMPKVGGPGRSPEQGADTEFVLEEFFARYEKKAERALGSGRMGKEDRKTVTGYFESVRRLIEASKKPGGGNG